MYATLSVSIIMEHVTPKTLRLEGHVTYLGHPRVPRADEVFWHSSNNLVPKYEDTLKYEHTIIKTRHKSSMVLNIYQYSEYYASISLTLSFYYDINV